MTKTCGECKFFVQSEYLDVCTVHSEPQSHNRKCDLCEYFKPKVITNGDKIIAGGMRAIVEVAKNRCQHCIYKNCDLDAVCLEVDCADGIEAWLNAPAESEGNNE